MAPSNSRQLLVWTLPTIAVLLSYIWYKRRRTNIEIDKNKNNCEHINNKDLKIIDKDKEINIPTAHILEESPKRLFSRSLSGVDSTPIDIVIPSKLKSSKSNPIVISDEDLDFEIEKIKSMKYGNSVDIRNNQQQELENRQKLSSASSSSSTTTTPKKLNNSPKKEATNSPILKETEEICNNNNSNDNNNNSENNNKSVEELSPKLSVEMAQKIETKPQQKPPTPPVVRNNPKKNKTNKERQINEDLQKQNGERDSANHSPTDAMMASPSLSCISDNHSEGSNDSGKGCSELNTPPPSRTPGTDDNAINVNENMMNIYQFVIPQVLVGRLIGKNGSVVHMIKEKTGANIIVKKHPNNNKLKLCIVDGTQAEINSALKIIREKFPLKRFPEVTLENACLVPEVATIPLVADHLYLKLVEAVNNDAILSCMVTPNHLFLQQPTHPSFPNLNILTGYMDACYTDTDSPLLPTPIPQNTVCAAFSVDHWLRATILSTDPESDISYVKFLDYGGFAYVPYSNLRQIRGDFMLLPFQAAECFLACVKPIGEDNVWPQEAYDLIGNVTKGTIIYTQVVDYTEDCIPLVYCYLVIGSQQLVFLNEELVNRGYAEWINMETSVGTSQNCVENTTVTASTSSSSNSNCVTTTTVAEA